jgi:hypothetical protein
MRLILKIGKECIQLYNCSFVVSVLTPISVEVINQGGFNR